MEDVHVSFEAETNSGVFRTSGGRSNSSAWERIASAAIGMDQNATNTPGEVRLPWYQALFLIREFLPLQRTLAFAFRSDTSSQELIKAFLEQLRVSRAVNRGDHQGISEADVVERLTSQGFTRRALRSFQVRDVAVLASLPHGANFSVPGAGKTTATLALHLLTFPADGRFLVVCPKSAFPAWESVVAECIDPEAADAFNSGSFMNLAGLEKRRVSQVFSTNQRYFVTNYEHFVGLRETFAFLLATNRMHLVLDESHRMKAGQLSQRGAALLSVANLPARKDILSGTPMPQGPPDIQSQLDFLWPGTDFGLRVQRGELPREVISGLYVRTTKDELGLPPVDRVFRRVPMGSAQGALYGIVTNEVLRQLSSFREGQGLDVVRARRSVMRLLQLASNPRLALRSIVEDLHLQEQGLIEAVVSEGMSPKMRVASEIARDLAGRNRKVVIWTIFTQNILDLENELAELNPVSLYGAVPSGDSNDSNTREGRLRRFHRDASCMVMIANPAAAGEGISLHEVCHEAVYVDRSYVSTHYLQSIDRIHRLGLTADTVTNITILQAAPPAGLGSIDYSVSRRLLTKIRRLQELLNDRDLHLIALDEEMAEEPVDYAVDIDDVIDLIEELEGQSPYDDSLGD